LSEDELPADQERYLAINEELAQVWPNISERKDAPDDADEWNGKTPKHDLLER
jgi:ferredoxin